MNLRFALAALFLIGANSAALGAEPPRSSDGCGSEPAELPGESTVQTIYR